MKVDDVLFQLISAATDPTVTAVLNTRKWRRTRTKTIGWFELSGLEKVCTVLNAQFQEKRDTIDKSSSAINMNMVPNIEEVER